MTIEDIEVGSMEDVGSLSDAFAARKQEAVKKRRKKKKSATLLATKFEDLYVLTGDHLGEGSYGRVETCRNVYTGLEYAVKIIEKRPGTYSRSKVLKEIEIYHLCRGHPYIIQLIEYFEEDDHFFLIFEKVNGGPLLSHIQARICFTEAEAARIVACLADALKHLHKQGIAHRDIKPDNVLCVSLHSPCPVKLCDFDLCSRPNSGIDIVSTPRLLTPVGSVEYMAPEVVDTFLVDTSFYDDDLDDEELTYDKRCDLWSLGIITYILLCGYVPFSGRCGTDCGWERGENCEHCQVMLFDNIKEGRVEFHDKYWSQVSDEAKDLIRRLLVKDASSRLDAAEVLAHPWIVSMCSRRLEDEVELSSDEDEHHHLKLIDNGSGGESDSDLAKTPTNNHLLDNKINNNHNICHSTSQQHEQIDKKLSTSSTKSSKTSSTGGSGISTAPVNVSGGRQVSLPTVANLQRQTSIKDLEDLANRAISVNRAVEEFNQQLHQQQQASFPVPVPIGNRFGGITDFTLGCGVGGKGLKHWRRETLSFDLSPPSDSGCSLLQRRRRSRPLLLEKNRFCSIDELELESFVDVDSIMKAI